MSKTASALTAATLPLAGTELMYVVQGGNSRSAPMSSVYIPGGTDVAVIDGGTGSSTASGARTNLGLAIGTDVQAYSANLASWAAVTRASGFDTFVATPSSANLRALLTDEVGTGAAYFVGGALGTPASGTATNLTGLPVATGISGLGTGVATFLATPTSANLAAALTDETGTGANVFANGPTLIAPVLGTPASGVMTNVTGLLIDAGTVGTLPIARGGTNATTVDSARLSLVVSTYVATRTALKALDTTKDTTAYLKESGREGIFVWTAGDFSASITADTAEGIYVKATAIASTVGAWVRKFDGPAVDTWFGTSHNNVADDSAALQSAIDLCQLIDVPLKLYPRGNYKLSAGLTVKHGQNSTDTKKYHFRLIGNDAQFLPDTGVTALSIVPRCTLADNTTGRGEAFIDIENLTIYGSASATAKALVIGAVGMWCSNIGNNRLHNVVAQSFGSTGAVSFIECRKVRVASLQCRSSTLLIQATTAGSIVGDLEFDFLEITGSTEALPGMKINATAASGLPQARGIVFNRCIFYACGYELRSSTSGLLGDIWFNACQWDSGPAGAGNIAMLVATGVGGKINGVHFNQPYIVNYTAEALKVQAANVGEITDINVIGHQIGTITPDNTGFNAAVTFIKIQNYRIVGGGFSGVTASDTGSSFIRSFLCSDFVISGNTASGSTSMTRGIQIDGGNTNYRIFGNSLDVSVAAQQIIDADLAISRHVFGNRGDATLAPLSANVNAIGGGLVPAHQLATVQGSDVSLANNITTAQAVFAAANDTLTVLAATTYRFKASLFIATGTTTHTTAFGFGGTATLTSIEYLAKLYSGTSGAINTTAPSILDVAVATATVLNATSAAAFTIIELEGTIRVNATGTLIPQVTFSAGPTGTCAVKVNSFMEMWPVGSNTVAAVGAWA